MKKKPTVNYSLNHLPRDTQTDWARVDALSDEAIEAAIQSDPDAAPILNEVFWKNAQLVLPSGQGKERITIRLDKEIIDYFKGFGPGYQKRINAILTAYIQSQRKEVS